MRMCVGHSLNMNIIAYGMTTYNQSTAQLVVQTFIERLECFHTFEPHEVF